MDRATHSPAPRPGRGADRSGRAPRRLVGLALGVAAAVLPWGADVAHAAGPWSVGDDGSTLVPPPGSDEAPLPAPCAAVDALDTAEALWLLCPTALIRLPHLEGQSLAELPAEAVTTRSLPLGATGRDLFLAGGQVYLAMDRTEAVPVATLGGGKAPLGVPVTSTGEPVPTGPDDGVPVTSTGEPVPDGPDDGVPVTSTGEPVPTPAAVGGRDADGRVVGQVTGYADGRPVVALPMGHGWRVGDRVALFEVVARSIGGEEELQERQVTVGEVSAVGERVAEVWLGVNQVVQEGSRVRKSAESKVASFIAPPRIGGTGYAGAELRGMVSLAQGGGGLHGGGYVGYRFELPIAIEARISPLSVGFGSGFGTIETSFTAYALFDHPLFAIGLGGGLTVTHRGATMPVFGQHLRLGARDGLMLSTWVQFRYGEPTWAFDAGDRWVVDDIDAVIQIPLSARGMPTWLLLAGSGGIHQFTGELGVRIRILGDGRKGTWALSPTIGATGIAIDNYGWSGPSVGLGMDTVF